MNEEIMNEIQPVRPKDQFTFSCRQCGACCRNIEGCVMVESLDAYCLARYLRAKGEPIEGIEDFLFRYCEPEPLTEEGFPIYMLKTKVPTLFSSATAGIVLYIIGIGLLFSFMLETPF